MFEVVNCHGVGLTVIERKVVNRNGGEIACNKCLNLCTEDLRRNVNFLNFIKF